ncbi:hypothetical protein NSA19_01075 [Actinomyces bowdenii]|uniref:hypothetical protein n=1 Tax=Actinomyces bowdenii TaxID=131109 RepID=UPI00214B82F5|nr:hypothetical protein [Actinomyces bowdenii]MCR2051469.1 hypothetical protein [Actinomyces bowdenii]
MRIRTIKPEFFDSPDTAKASPVVRLAFIGLWCCADDTGRGTCNPKEIEGAIFPHDDLSDLSRGEFAAIRGVLRQVAAAYGVLFYTVRGRDYFQITSWSRHQRVREGQASRLPGPEEGEVAEWCREVRADSHGSDSLPQVAADRGGSRLGTGEQGNRGTGEQLEAPLATEPVEKSSEHADACHTSEDHPEPKPRSKRGTRLPTDWQPTPELRQWAIDNRPDLDVDAETEIFRDYWISKTGAQATKADWKATYRNWIRRAHSRPKKTGPGENPYYALAAQYAQEGR